MQRGTIIYLYTLSSVLSLWGLVETATSSMYRACSAWQARVRGVLPVLASASTMRRFK